MNKNNDFIKPYLAGKSLGAQKSRNTKEFLNHWATPKQYFYIRNNLKYLELTQESFLLPIGGQVANPKTFHYYDLLYMPSKPETVVIECSGNKSQYFESGGYEEQRKDDAISQGTWKGVPLRYLLEMAGVKACAKEVIFIGHDYGKRRHKEGLYSFARSMPIDKALHPDVIVAYEYNGKPIPYKKGYPLRLIVPGWYGMASVKWLKRIEAIDHGFTGPFQADDHVYYPHKDSDEGKFPVTTINVDSTIQQPLNLSILDTGIHIIKGIAWTGEGVITKVEISINNGLDWQDADLHQDPNQPYGWVFWSYNWKIQEKGEHTIMSRASDSHGRVQPMEVFWNRKGYGYNAVYKIKVNIE